MDLAQPISSQRRLVHLAPPAVRSGDGLETMARAIASDPAASLAFVVDDHARLLGMVRRRDLDVQLLARALPRVAARRMGETDQRAAFGWAKGAGLQAVDIMSRVEPANTDESFSVAIERALDADLDAMPVIDRSGRLLGYLSVFEVLVASFDDG